MNDYDDDIARGLREKMNSAYDHLESLMENRGWSHNRAWNRIIKTYNITNDDIDNFVELVLK